MHCLNRLFFPTCTACRRVALFHLRKGAEMPRRCGWCGGERTFPPERWGIGRVVLCWAYLFALLVWWCVRLVAWIAVVLPCRTIWRAFFGTA